MATGVTVLETVKALLARELERRGRLLLAIDGRCGSGKTSLAAALAQELGGNVFHMDDFYLPFAARGEGWQSVPAGNMDLDRLRREVLLPLRAGENVLYRAFDCRGGRFYETEHIPFRPLSIVEGSYSLHPSLRDFYDLRLFLTLDPALQRERLLRREGAARFKDFEALWIPMEERYFDRCAVRDCADCVMDTGRDRARILQMF